MVYPILLKGHDLKKTAKLSTQCPICLKNIPYGVEMHLLDIITKYPFPHIVLHGNPLHAMIVYLDTNYTVRAVESGQSIEVQKSQETFTQLLNKWSNPF